MKIPIGLQIAEAVEVNVMGIEDAACFGPALWRTNKKRPFPTVGELPLGVRLEQIPQ